MLTRTINSAQTLPDAKRPWTDVLRAHVNLGTKHEEFTMFLNDEDYDEAEIWMFGDHPDLAMAITAMRKTSKMDKMTKT